MVKTQEKKKRTNPYLPIIGLVLAGSVAVIAVFSAPLMFDGVGSLYENFQDQTFEQRLGVVSFETEAGESLRQQMTIAFGVLIWIVVFALLMGVLSAALGDDPEEEARLVKPRLGDKKATEKYFRDLDKLEAKKAKREKEKEKRR